MKFERYYSAARVFISKKNICNFFHDIVKNKLTYTIDDMYYDGQSIFYYGKSFYGAREFYNILTQYQEKEKENKYFIYINKNHLGDWRNKNITRTGYYSFYGDNTYEMAESAPMQIIINKYKNVKGNFDRMDATEYSENMPILEVLSYLNNIDIGKNIYNECSFFYLTMASIICNNNLKEFMQNHHFYVNDIKKGSNIYKKYRNGVYECTKDYSQFEDNIINFIRDMRDNDLLEGKFVIVGESKYFIVG